MPNSPATGNHIDDLATRSLTDAEPRVFWTDRPGAPEPADPLVGPTDADLVVVGGGLTGLWTALWAVEADPDRDVVLLEGQHVAAGASGRNGGFFSDSLTHGMPHGAALWPDELPTLVRLGRRNLQETVDFITAEGIEADLRLCGKSDVAVRPHQVAGLRESWQLLRKHGEEVELMDAEAARADVASPTYLAALRVRSGGGLVDPARLCHGLRAVALRRGVRLYENTEVRDVRSVNAGLRVETAAGTVHAGQVVLATNAYRPLLRRLSPFVLPIYDHVLVTEPLAPEQLASLGWRENQGLSDAGNQFHYYRRTPDDRILWGGYDANYYFGSRRDAALEQKEQTNRRLARHFFETFPQLAGLRFSHRWAGLIDTTSRFTPFFGTALGGRLGYTLGFTGLGVGSSRFAAGVVLDLLAGRETEGTRLSQVRRRPIPFPPEPLRWVTVQGTRAALAREDVTGRRGAWLRLLDRFGVGFDS
jgi:glycine/D-amino acid oxidase-like deaminating enzyme